MLKKIIVTGGEGRFARELKKFKSNYKFFFRKKNQLNILSSRSIDSNLKKFKKRLDPRLYNGAIFIGLNNPVVKSHGGTDFIGFSNSLDVCNRIVQGNLIEKIKLNI